MTGSLRRATILKTTRRKGHHLYKEKQCCHDVCDWYQECNLVKGQINVHFDTTHCCKLYVPVSINVTTTHAKVDCVDMAMWGLEWLVM